ncbi:hypothetical protein [Nocardiopsis sp. MG754419]|uniref:hypothetical protein n=1 Tax=Nocardiopsis sp. MG754419 TaxID=2259865 RepID=UPI001BA9D19C|nr:hypothetical protein [Nocardiopsis sp. MG754419]MBR8742786.1 hypothetical protein [Nocardiopsis sp. MG754419]
MPRLSHTLDLDAWEREDVVDAVDGVHRVLRSARFDDAGVLVVPDEAELERLERRAEELGVVDPQARREQEEQRGARAERLAEELRELERQRAAQVAEHGRPSTETEVSVEERSLELRLMDTESSLRLVSGEHLTPGAHYLLSTVDEDGTPAFSEGAEGWVGTDLALTSWEPEGDCTVDFAMREDPEATGFEDPVTRGTVTHDRAARTLTARGRMRFPTPVGLLGKDSSLLRVEVSAHIDLPGWYARLSGTEGPAPARFEVRHPLVRAVGEALPSPGPNGRWSVATSLEVRGRGLARPLVAVAAWALLRSLRRSQEMSVEAWVAEVERSWARTARALPALPGLLDELAVSMENARPHRT